MLALCVRDAGAAAAPPRPLPPGFERRAFGRLDVTWAARPPYGFVVPLEEGLAVGEALWSVEPEVLLEAAEAARRAPGTLELPDGVLGLFIVDGVAGTLTGTASIRSTRPYSFAPVDGGFAAATSLRALRTLGVELALASSRVAEVLAYRYVAAPRTLCRGVDRFVGGQVLSFDIAGGSVAESHHHVFPAGRGNGHLDESQVVDTLERALTDDVGHVLEHSKRASVLMSGGLDSTAVAGFARAAGRQPRSDSSSFSFLDPADGEETYALTAAEHLGLEHQVHRGTEEGYLRALIQGIDLVEEPLHHLQSVMLLSLFANLASDGVDTALSGEGADGLFGTSEHTKLNKYRTFLRIARATGAQALYRWALTATHIDSERLAWFGLDFDADPRSENHLLWTLGAFGDPGTACRIAGTDLATLHETRRALMAPYADLELLQQVSVLSLLGEGATTLGIWGKLAEAHGIVLASPFTAPDVVATTLALPWSEKLREPKHLVRALLRKQGVPGSIIDRPKLGFGLPCHHWAPRDALFQPLADLAAQRYDAALIHSLQDGNQDDAMLLWSLISLDLWQRLVLEDVPAADLADEIVQRRMPASAS